jgi:hypothetical protein
LPQLPIQTRAASFSKYLLAAWLPACLPAYLRCARALQAQIWQNCADVQVALPASA